MGGVRSSSRLPYMKDNWSTMIWYTPSALIATRRREGKREGRREGGREGERGEEFLVKFPCKIPHIRTIYMY